MMILIIVLVISVLLNLIFIVFDFGPFYWPKIERKINPYKSLNRDWNLRQSIFLEAALKTMYRKKPLMVWKDPRGISEQLFELKHHTSKASFKKYNYPRAFLLYGICEYALVTKDENVLSTLRHCFDKYLDLEGNPTFVIDKVDQSGFGIVAIKLYRVYKEQKYYNFASHIFEYLLNNFEKNNTFLLYRPGQKAWLNDVLGLTIPFLVEYYKLTSIETSILIAKQQVQHFIKSGIDLQTFIPAHGIDLTTNLKIGSANWGRGIGWFYIALKELYDFDGSFKKEYLGLSNTLLNATTEEGLWSQFPGSSNYYDASATITFLYCLPSTTYNLILMLEKLDKYISKGGFIKQTSGDTYGANSYSKTFGLSEFSQGMMLLLLSKHKK